MTIPPSTMYGYGGGGPIPLSAFNQPAFPSQHPIYWWPGAASRVTGAFQIIWGGISFVGHGVLIAVLILAREADCCANQPQRDVHVSAIFFAFTGPMYIVAGIFGMLAANHRTSWVVGAYLGLSGAAGMIGALSAIVGTALMLDVDIRDLYFEEVNAPIANTELEGLLRAIIAVEVILITVHAAEAMTALMAISHACKMPGCWNRSVMPNIPYYPAPAPPPPVGFPLPGPGLGPVPFY